MLWLIWSSSLALASLSLLAMACLIVARMLSAGRARRLAEQRAELLAGLLERPGDAAQEKQLLKSLARNKALSIDVLIELFENMRGDEQTELAQLADRAGLVAHIQRVLKRGRIRDRLIAAECLVWFPTASTVEALRAAGNDRSIEVCLAAASSLIEIAPDFAFEEKLGHLDRRESSRRLEALLTRAARRSPLRLIAVAENELRTDRVRAAALESLSQAGAHEVLERIIALAQSPSIDIRGGAARCLGASGHPAAEPAIGALLEDPAWQVRVRAADAAGALNAVGLGEKLCVMIEDENWWVRLRSAEALAKLGDTGVKALKDIIARQSNIESAQTAALILAERRNVA